MISQRKLIADYNKMINLPEIKDGEKDKINLYTCDDSNGRKCKNAVKTIDLVAGTTPFKVDCSRCGSQMTSAMYTKIPKKPEVTMEWFRPELNQVLKWRRKPGLIEHLLKGGLMLRPIIVERKPNVLEMALAVLQSLKFKAMPTHQEFYDKYTEDLREALELGPEVVKEVKYGDTVKTKVVKLKKDGK